MTKRMLIDATHPDETRVVVLNGKAVEEFDYETASKTQIKGNIYLAKVTRVEPSLQAAFIDYGGNRHGFLPFSEIHPDYYRIPIADREALIAEEARLRGEAADEASDGELNGEANGDGNGESDDGAEAEQPNRRRRSRAARNGSADEEESLGEGNGGVEEIAQETKIDTVGGEEVEDPARRRAQLLRRYKIQEVIKRRQVMLVQVTKEERGNKGAALTTYLSLAGRYCVLMPNTAKGGGISRKISNATDRRRLKSVIGEMSIPEGMAVIVRTAGSQRTKAEIKRDYEYLIRLWDDIRSKTLQSTAPCLIHEEASLIKRAIRDLYDRDMDEVLVEGGEGYKNAKDFMKMLMPSHARKVKPYVDPAMPLFHRYQVESQLDAMYSPQVQLRSGGSIVLNPTEALVAIDVNSGRSTRERHIEETALKTNLEAAEEVARQLRLRDLAGLIVIDFIDMEESRHNREVERRLKEAMRSDRARIQLGRISPFGLLELSRQRLRPSLFETAMMQCHRCNGTGYVRAPAAAALVVLRAITEEGVRKGGGELEVRVPIEVALHMLNEKRDHVVELEQRFGLRIRVRAGENMGPADFEILRHSTEATQPAERREIPIETAEAEEPEVEQEAREEAEEEDGGRRRSRRRRGGRREREEERPAVQARAPRETAEEEADATDEEGVAARQHPADEEGDEERKAKRRRRGRRGGRRRSRRRQEEGQELQGDTADQLAPEQASESDDEPGDEPVAEPSYEPDAVIEAHPVAAEAAGETPEPQEEPVPKSAEPAGIEAETPPPAVAEAAVTEAEPAKPARRSRSRKTAKPTAEAEAATPAATADEAPAEAEAAPKKPTRRRRKPVAAEAVAEPVSEPAPEVVSEPADIPTAAVEPAAAQPSSEPAEAPVPASQPVGNGAAAPAEEQAREQLEEQVEEQVTSPTPPPAPETQAEDRPRRKGWWNRLMS